jgi:hypothetical protein
MRGQEVRPISDAPTRHTRPDDFEVVLHLSEEMPRSGCELSQIKCTTHRFNCRTRGPGKPMGVPFSGGYRLASLGSRAPSGRASRPFDRAPAFRGLRSRRVARGTDGPLYLCTLRPATGGPGGAAAAAASAAPPSPLFSDGGGCQRQIKSRPPRATITQFLGLSCAQKTAHQCRALRHRTRR